MSHNKTPIETNWMAAGQHLRPRLFRVAPIALAHGWGQVELAALNSRGRHIGCQNQSEARNKQSPR